MTYNLDYFREHGEFLLKDHDSLETGISLLLSIYEQDQDVRIKTVEYQRNIVNRVGYNAPYIKIRLMTETDLLRDQQEQVKLEIRDIAERLEKLRERLENIQE